MAYGIADDFLSTMVLAATAKILVCPAMNTLMFENAIVKENIRKLKERGIEVMEPGEGQLACRAEGKGRLPEPEDIIETASILLSEQDLSGLTILVTAGATIEPLDPVRYITNRSSGKMGYALARAAAGRGAQAILVSGPTALDPPIGITYIGVKTAEEMRKAVLDRRRDCNVIIKAAAVSDYRPKEMAENKIKKRNESLSIELVKNPDILAELGNEEKNYRQILVGFAAETQDLMSNAEEKLKSKGLDMIVANDVSRADAGFETDTNIVKILYKNGKVEDSGLLTKHEVADLLLDRVKKLWEDPIEHA
jgi:phosphopantothenoylcysteine decarboxylase/phosphopantothenate--cysteine ligase